MTALGDHTVLLPEGIAGLIGAPGFGQDPLFVVGMENLYQELGVLPPFLGSVAEHLFYLWAHVDGGVDLVYPVYVGDRRYVFHQGAVALLGLPEPSLCLKRYSALLVATPPSARAFSVSSRTCARSSGWTWSSTFMVPMASSRS